MIRRLHRGLVLALLALAAMTANAIRTSNLKCEMLANPCGISTVQPHLSWQIPTERNGIRQTAYHILAATTPELLSEEKADLWNSGKVKSDQSIWVDYAGKPLTSRSQVYWKVKVWDEQDKESGWSATARFTVGLLERADWHGAFIGMERSDTTALPMLWKTFNIPQTRKAAYLHICTLGYHEIYLNGQRVSNDVLVPAVVPYDKRYPSMTYDVTGLLQQGPNDLVIWLGKGWYDAAGRGPVGGGPYVMAEIDATDNGTEWQTLVTTDKTWKARQSGYYSPGSWTRIRFDGEVVKAGELLTDLTLSSLEGATWQQAIEAKVPDMPITPMMCEPNRIMERLRPQGIRYFSPGTWMVDMGKSVVGWTEVRLGRLRPGQHITISYCDMLGLNGDFEAGVFTDHYIASGNGEEEVFTNKFNYHAYRYIKIQGLDQAPEYTDITSSLIHTGYRNQSSFVCNDDEINAIHNMIHYTFQCLTQSGYMVDCPHMERQGYGGDGNASTLSLQNMFDVAPLYLNWLQAWNDAIQPDGGLPHTAPCPYKAGGGPYWCSFIVQAPWRTWMNFGDDRPLRRSYANMKLWLQYVDAYTQDGLLRRWPDLEYRNWYLGDWLAPEGVDVMAQESVDLVDNCALSQSYAELIEIARYLGEDADRQDFERRREALNQRIHETFYHPESHTYGTGSQLDMAYPLLTDVAPADIRDSVQTALLGGRDHLGVGLVGVPVLAEWLTRSHAVDFMYTMLRQEDYPGYLYMLRHGATATWENWRNPRSSIHNCFNGIDSWFVQALGGIIPTEPGYKTMLIDPQVPQGLQWVTVTRETPYGQVLVHWEQTPQGTKAHIQVPPGTTAILQGKPVGSGSYDIML